MGRLERQGAKGFIKYIWYPGEVKDWKRALISLGSGIGSGLVVGLLFQSILVGVVIGASVTAVITGYAFGQKDAKALEKFGTLRTTETPRALWRALVKGFGTTIAAVLVVHVAETGLDGWILPMVPAIAAAISHQFGMAQVRIAEHRAKEKEERKAAERQMLQDALEHRARLEEERAERVKARQAATAENDTKEPAQTAA